MSQRLNYFEQSSELTQKLFEFSGAIKKSSLGNTLIDLVNIRASQLNGCAFCLDMHSKEAKIHGEQELRIMQHGSKPKYRLVITLAPAAGGTTVSWTQTFESEEIAKRIERIVVPANEENLDRLSSEVLRISS